VVFWRSHIFAALFTAYGVMIFAGGSVHVKSVVFGLTEIEISRLHTQWDDNSKKKKMYA
jgi:hypothetical protein